MESRAGASSGHGGTRRPCAGGQACQGWATAPRPGDLAGVGGVAFPRGSCWYVRVGEEGPCARGGVAAPCPRADAWGSSGGGQ
jgi:hypothetical protein